MLEHTNAAELSPETYLEIAGRRHVELYRLFFDHGVETLLTPVFGPDILGRGISYAPVIEAGLTWFARDQAFLDFYKAYDVRVRVYGDTARYLESTPYEDALIAFEALDSRTASHQQHRLFFGVCAHDATETVAQFSINFHQMHGRPPSKQEIIEGYYGEYISPVDLFIGFDRPAAFDMPLIATGSEDLYFTVSPSPYLDAETLRLILYDHMYARCIDDADYHTMTINDLEALHTFYHRNLHHVLGLGQRQLNSAVWLPRPQVEPVEKFEKSTD
jgi:tuberculosinol/isotuberculosinol synthase